MAPSKLTTGTDAAVQARDLTRRYGGLLAVDHLTLELRRGELLALLGPNGAGKTTLMRMLCGVLRPDGGTIRVLGAPDHELRQAQRRHIGYCPQALIVWRDLTCVEQLELLAEMFRVPRVERRRRTTRLLDALGLADKAGARAGALSGGMKRRLNLALALIHDPQVLILDEPEAGLDPQSRVLLREVIRDLARRQGKAILVSTHDMDEADRLSDRVAVMDRGRLIALDSAAALKARGGAAEMIEIALGSTSEDRRHAALQAVRAVTPDVVRVDDVLVIRGPAALRPGSPRHALEPQALEAVQRALAALHVEADEIRFRRRTLEDVFIELTGRRLRD